MRKIIKIISVLVLLFSLNLMVPTHADAATKIMWGKTELKLGQIGKVTVLSDTTLVKLESNGTLSDVRPMKKGEEYRVYSFKAEHNGLYGVGGGSFVKKDVVKVKYETPSKAKLALLEETASASTKIMWGKTELKLGQIGKVTILSDTDLVKLQSNGSLSTVRSLKKGEEYRVYSYKSTHGGLYGVGGGSFVKENSNIKYETPSK